MEHTAQSQGRTRPRATGTTVRSVFVLAAGDIPILRTIFEHRFLDRGQLSRLLQRHEKRLHRRLFSLERAGYLTTIRLPQQSYLYGIRFMSPNESIDTGTDSPMSKFLLHLFAAFVEMERGIIRERVCAGVRAAKAKECA